MIIGTGIDLIETARLARTLERHGDRFLDHIYTRNEQDAAPESPAGRTAYFAGRWAAKEALAKALGTGIGQECAWTDIEVSNGAQGRPFLRLGGAAAQTAVRLGAGSIHLSITHEKHYACAQVIIENA